MGFRRELRGVHLGFRVSGCRERVDLYKAYLGGFDLGDKEFSRFRVSDSGFRGCREKGFRGLGLVRG